MTGQQLQTRQDVRDTSTGQGVPAWTMEAR